MRCVLRTKWCLCAVRMALLAAMVGGLVGPAAGVGSKVTQGNYDRGMGDEWPARYAVDTPSTLAAAPLPADGTILPAVIPSGSDPAERATPDGLTGK
jgi:hypothetical protein